jgi:hypothetical protein
MIDVLHPWIDTVLHHLFISAAQEIDQCLAADSRGGDEQMR